jgi:hypothetical protein
MDSAASVSGMTAGESHPPPTGSAADSHFVCWHADPEVANTTATMPSQRVIWA